MIWMDVVAALDDEAALREDAALFKDELDVEVVDEAEVFDGDENGGASREPGGRVAVAGAGADVAGACPFDSAKLRRAVINKLSTAVVIGLSIFAILLKKIC